LGIAESFGSRSICSTVDLASASRQRFAETLQLFASHRRYGHLILRQQSTVFATRPSKLMFGVASVSKTPATLMYRSREQAVADCIEEVNNGIERPRQQRKQPQFQKKTRQLRRASITVQPFECDV
jgi:hypothetical protein